LNLIGKIIMKTKYLFCALCFAVMAIFPLLATAKGTDMLEMSDEFDQLDKQDFHAAIDRANACTQARNFPCAESELAKAAKAANSGKDKKTLLASRNSLTNEKQQLANEIAERQAQIRRDKEERQAQKRRDEEEDQARERLAERERRDAQEAENRQSSGDASAGIYADMQKNILGNMQQINSNLQSSVDAYAASNRARAAQDEERNRAARAALEERQEQRRRDADRERADAQRVAENREADAARAQRDREQKRQDEERRNQEVRDSNERKRVAEAAAAKQKADTAAAKLAEQKAEKLASEQYLKSLAAGTRLVATQCPDGEGKYYATGTKPTIKPEVVGCVDVHYRAYCAGNAQYSTGIARNFVGMAGCFGDTYEISPKPNCSVDQVRIEVVEARGCGGG